MMYRVVWSMASLLLLGGCTQKYEEDLLHSYQKTKTYHKWMMKTEKIHFYDHNGTTQAVVTATYKPNTKEKGEAFIVGIYGDESPKCSYRLNGKAPLKIKQLDASDVDLEKLSFVVPWKEFYLVTFPQTERKRLNLHCVLQGVGEGEMYFAKRAKYTLSKNKKAF